MPGCSCPLPMLLNIHWPTTDPIVSGMLRLSGEQRMTTTGLRPPLYPRVAVVRWPSERSLPDWTEHHVPVSGVCPALQPAFFRLIRFPLSLFLECPCKAENWPFLRDAPCVGRQTVVVIHKISVAEIEPLVWPEAAIDHYFSKC